MGLRVSGFVGRLSQEKLNGILGRRTSSLPAGSGNLGRASGGTVEYFRCRDLWRGCGGPLLGLHAVVPFDWSMFLLACPLFVAILDLLVIMRDICPLRIEYLRLRIKYLQIFQRFCREKIWIQALLEARMLSKWCIWLVEKGSPWNGLNHRNVSPSPFRNLLQVSSAVRTHKMVLRIELTSLISWNIFFIFLNFRYNFNNSVYLICVFNIKSRVICHIHSVLILVMNIHVGNDMIGHLLAHHIPVGKRLTDDVKSLLSRHHHLLGAIEVIY